MDSLAINGEQKLGKTSVIINTGITLLMGDTEAVKELYSTIEGAKDGSETIQPGFYSGTFKFTAHYFTFSLFFHSTLRQHPNRQLDIRWKNFRHSSRNLQQRKS